MQQERRRRTQEPIKGFKKNAQADAVGSVVVLPQRESAVHRIRVVSGQLLGGWVDGSPLFSFAFMLCYCRDVGFQFV
jgi:hypothetical protein